MATKYSDQILQICNIIYTGENDELSKLETPEGV